MTLRRFLLSQCTEEEEERVLAAAFDDSDFAERLEAMEVEIADEYVLGELTQAERDGFELRLERNPASQDSVAMSEALVRRYRKRRLSPWWWAVAAAAACVGFLVLVTLLPKAVDAPSGPLPVTQELAERIVVWRLTPGLVRSSQASRNRFTHPGADAVIDFRVNTAKPTQSKSRIETVEGDTLWSGVSEPVGAGQISVRVPARLLPRDDLILFVDGLPSLTFSIR
jgi:hypothetical protein